jgi:hypothetical protein
MPKLIITDEQIVAALEKQTHKEYKRYLPEWKFLRSALNRELIGDKSQATEIAIEQKMLRQEEMPGSGVRDAFRNVNKYGEEESYLIRQPVESDLAYAIRLLFGFDGNESYQTLRTLVGYLLKDTTLNLDGFAQDYRDRIEKNIDGQGTTFKEFLGEASEEIGGLGKAYGWIYQSMGDKIPIHEFIDRENVSDWHKNKTDFIYVKFEDCRESFLGVTRAETKRTVILTPEEWFFCSKDSDDKWVIQREAPKAGREGFFIPFVDGWCGKYAKSLVATAAYLQFMLLNADSVAFQIIRNQMLGIITGPTGTKDQLQTLSTATVVDIPPESSRGLEIVGFPKQTIDGHFEYLSNMSAKVSKSANLREQVSLGASGESKDWDFMPTSSLLDRFADYVEAYVNQVLGMFEKFAGIQPSKEKRFSIKREFDKKGLKETLEIIFSGMALQLGSTMNEKLKLRAAEAFKQLGVEPSEQEWKVIEKEIRETGKSNTLEKLMEVNINGQNQKTTAGATGSGSEDDAGDSGGTGSGD